MCGEAWRVRTVDGVPKCIGGMCERPHCTCRDTKTPDLQSCRCAQFPETCRGSGDLVWSGSVSEEILVRLRTLNCTRFEHAI
jgi:hypothetical protein